MKWHHIAPISTPEYLGEDTRARADGINEGIEELLASREELESKVGEQEQVDLADFDAANAGSMQVYENIRVHLLQSELRLRRELHELFPALEADRQKAANRISVPLRSAYAGRMWAARRRRQDAFARQQRLAGRLALVSPAAALERCVAAVAGTDL